MTDMEILQLADNCGVMAIKKHEWDGNKFNHTDDYLDGDAAALIIFAKQLTKKREWVGLTEEEVKEICLANRPYVSDMVVVLEARLKEKNGYT
jgi:hypothetical protein